jgi:hypothetical protein
MENQKWRTSCKPNTRPVEATYMKWRSPIVSKHENSHPVYGFLTGKSSLFCKLPEIIKILVTIV